MYKYIVCNIFRKEVESLISEEKLKDVIFVEQGLHNNPPKMKAHIEKLMNDLEDNEDILNNYKGIVLLYGLCGNGTLGLKTSKLKLIIPKAHDCMTLFLGSKEKYREIIDNNRGVYWYNHAWIEQTPMPCKDQLESIKRDYYEYYDEDNAEYLYEIEVEALKRYRYGVLVTSPLVSNDKYKYFLGNACEEFGWSYKEESGELTLIERLLNGIFNEEEVLMLNPNEAIKLSLDNNILTSESLQIV